MSKTLDRLEGGSEVIITGKNFAPESLVILGDTVITDAIIESATRIRIAQVPKQKAPGDRTLSVRTRGGVAQTKFSIFSKPFSELKTGEITTIAGGVPFLGDSGLATNATFNAPQDVLVDSNGNILISDSGSGRIRRIDDTNVITTIAGTGAITSNGDNSLAIAAGLNVPTSTAIDSAGNIFIADSRGDRVRKIDARTGIITSAIGTGVNGFSGDNGQANNARLSFPIGVAIDSFDNLYIADSGNSRIRKVNLKTNIITTVAGSSRSGFSGDGGPATLASLGFVNQVNVDSLGNIFIVDNSLDPEANARIRRVDIRTGVITTVAGNSDFRFNGDNIPALSASIDPFDVEIDQAGNIFFADLANHRIRRVDAQTAIITTVAGNGISAFNGDGGLATNASLSAPNGIALDGMGNLIIADQLNNRIRKVDARTGIITTIAGSELPIGDNDLAIKANVGDPFSVVVESSGNILISDSGNRRVRRVNIANGSITTIAGNGTLGFSGDNGPATQASFAPNTIAQDSNGNIFIVDPVFHVVRRITPTGTINTVAGTGKFGFSGDNGLATNAQLDSPRGIAVDSAGNLFIADLFNSRIRRVDARTGIITSVAGNGRANITGDGGPATQASLAFPLAVTVDRNNNIFILDLVGNLVRRIDGRTGIITTIAGTGNASFSGDGGPAINAAINTAFGLIADNNGNLFIADTGNSRIRRIDTNGIIATVAGNNTPDYSGDGMPATTASLNRPKGIAFDSAGNLYIAGGFNNSIRVVKVMAANNALTITNAQFIKPNLTITGNGFGSTGAVVQVNGQNISQFITSQSATSITLKGNKKKLNIKKGQNSVTVTLNGMVSNTFNFNF
jgi:trimeric autotransporter adhesin